MTRATPADITRIWKQLHGDAKPRKLHVTVDKIAVKQFTVVDKEFGVVAIYDRLYLAWDEAMRLNDKIGE